MGWTCKIPTHILQDTSLDNCLRYGLPVKGYTYLCRFWLISTHSPLFLSTCTMPEFILGCRKSGSACTCIYLLPCSDRSPWYQCKGNMHLFWDDGFYKEVCRVDFGGFGAGGARIIELVPSVGKKDEIWAVFLHVEGQDNVGVRIS